MGRPRLRKEELMSATYTLNETLIKVDGVSLTLGGNQILKDVNAEIKNIVRPGYTQGQVVGFLGPSGIGKTQLLKILAGLQKNKYSGNVLISNKGLPVRPGMVGVVTQKYFLRPNYTVLRNLTVAAGRRGISSKEAKEKSFHMLGRFGLQDRTSLYPEQLSGGQRQRVAIAQQLLCSEHFLLMDEPFSGLDPIMKDKVCELITEVASAHELNTIIVVSHDISATISIADTLWLMGRDIGADGKIIPGAKLKYVYDLAEKGLAWHPDIQLMPRFSDLVREVKEKFRIL